VCTTATTYHASNASCRSRPGAPRCARLLCRLLDDHRLSLHGGVPARQARDLSAGSDVVGRLAGADELPAAKRRPGKASFRDLLQDDPHESSLMRNLAVIHGPPTLDRGAEQLRFPTASDTVTWTRRSDEAPRRRSANTAFATAPSAGHRPKRPDRRHVPGGPTQVAAARLHAQRHSRATSP